MRLHLLLLLLMLAAGLPGRTALAQVVAPTQGGDVSAVRVTATTMELSFGDGGNGQGRVVAMAATKSGMPVPLAATDGQFYTASSIYSQGSSLGRGYAVYNGTGNSVLVTGLQPNTYYYLVNAEYNTDGSTIAYNTRGTSTVVSTLNAPTNSFDPAPLPVKLISFNGTVDAHNLATLHWSTASEHNSSYFALERSANGTIFTEVGRVTAAINSNKLLVYQWLDSQYLLNPTYYRLRQVDNDGTVHYSSVITLAPALRTARLIEVFPNPSTGQAIQLLLQGYDGEALTLQVADAVGRTVMAQKVVPANAQYLVPLTLPQGLATGTYVLTLGGTSSPVQKRIIVSD
jgi:hypothetical protein